MKKIAILVAAAGFAAGAMGQVRFNEVFVNPPSPEVDNTREFIELKSSEPFYDMAGLWIIQIDGDNNAAGDSIATGVIDQALPLSSKATGANKLFLWRDAAAPILTPIPDAATVVFVGDFLPDLENGSATYLIVRDFTGTVGQDLDTNNDGVLDATPWSAVLDAVGFIDGDNFDEGIPSRQYATQLGGVDVTDTSPGAPGFTPDAFARVCGGHVSHDILGTSPGPYVPDPLETRLFPSGPTLDGNYTLTPGNENIECGPPPCVADVDDGSGTGTPDGGVTIEDLLYYLGLFDLGSVDADVDDGTGTGTPDGGVTIEDLLYYLLRFDLGC